MEKLKYTVIKTETQYNKYCRKLELLLDSNPKSKAGNDEIELLTVLIEIWDNEHNDLTDADPIELLLSLMEGRGINPKELSEMLEVSKGYVSDILHYKKGLSKDVIRRLSHYFKVSQEAFNRPYKLKSPVNNPLQKSPVAA